MSESARILRLLERQKEIGEPQAAADFVAGSAARLAGYRRALLTLATVDGSLIGSHGLQAEEIHHFQETSRRATFAERAERRGRLRKSAFPGTGITYIPGAARADWNVLPTPAKVEFSPGGWAAEDALFVLVAGAGGGEIGVLSLDAPEDGQAPCAEDLDRLRTAERYVSLAGVQLAGRLHERQLLESKDLLREIAVNVGEVLWMTDAAKSRFLFVNPAYERVWGRPVGSLLADPRSWLEVVHPDDREQVVSGARERQAAGDWDLTYRLLRPDGSIRWIHETARPVKDHAGEVVRIVGVAEDLTALVEAHERMMEQEARLHQTQRATAVGRLVGGVAHDFNNLLTVIGGCSEILLGREPGETEGMLLRIREAVEQARRMTNRLLAFTRGMPRSPQVFSLGGLVSSIRPILQRLVGEDIGVVADCDTPCPDVFADRGQMEQVLMNLVANARDAMPGGGTLRIAVGPAQTAPEPAGEPPLGVRLTVEDSGEGMSPEVLARIFEPFFTTKEEGRGTGIGLSTVRSILDETGGEIDVASRPGEGTTFTILLPAVEGGALERSEPEWAAETSRGETVLLVEDDDSVREVATEMLEDKGYRVIGARNGDEAVRRFSEKAADVRIVVTDVVMSGKSGPEIAAAIRALAPGLPVLFTSGYAGEALVRHGIRVGSVEFLEKPYRQEDLCRRVRLLLDRAS